MREITWSVYCIVCLMHRNSRLWLAGLS